jgi:hypothetical protein
MFDPEKPPIVETDASNFGLEAVLLQLDNNGNKQPVYN